MANALLIYSSYCLRDVKGFDFVNHLDDERGLTGSEYGLIRVAQELRDMGHSVTIATFGSLPPDWESIRLIHYADRHRSEYDWAVSWNEAGSLRSVQAEAKGCSLQINTVVGPQQGCEDPHGAADLWFCPSGSHHVRLAGSSPGRWEVVPDGVDPHLYPTGAAARALKVPGRVSWTSSPDRGLHWLLSVWPRVRQAVPWASLRVFYSIDKWLKHFDNDELAKHPEPSIIEQYNRAKYIERVMPLLAGQGVEVVGGVSRRRLVQEVSETECVAYSCDTVLWSEGFSCSLMEACAASACPVSTQVDAFPEVYGGVIPLAGMPLGANLDEFAGYVIRALTDAPWRDEVNERATAHAEKHTWKRMAETKARLLAEVQDGKRAFVSPVREIVLEGDARVQA